MNIEWPILVCAYQPSRLFFRPVFMEVSSYLPVLPAAPAAGFVFQCTWPSAAVKAWRGVKERYLPAASASQPFNVSWSHRKKTTTIRNCVCFRGFDCHWYAVWTSNISGMTTMSFLPRAYSLCPGLILRLDSTASSGWFYQLHVAGVCLGGLRKRAFSEWSWGYYIGLQVWRLSYELRPFRRSLKMNFMEHFCG